MRLKFVKSIASFDFDYQAGQVAEIEDEDQARAWCASGTAEQVSRQPEAAVTVGASERAMRPRARGRR